MSPTPPSAAPPPSLPPLLPLLLLILALVVAGVVAGIAFSGCFSVPTLEAPDAGPPPPPPRLLIRDHAGREQEAQSLPRSPIFYLELGAPFSAAEPPLFLIEGEAEAELIEDFEALPLRRGTEERSLSLSLAEDGATLEARPLSPLRPGAVYTLILGAWIEIGGRSREAPLAFALRTSTEATAGAAAIASWPADGSAGVSPTLTEIEVAFDGELGAAEGLLEVRLASPPNTTLATEARRIDCAAAGFSPEARACLALRLMAVVPPRSELVVSITEGAVDLTGAPIPAWEAHIALAAESPAEAPRWLPGACALDEEALDLGCLLLDDEHAELELWLDRAARLSLSVELEGGLYQEVRLAPRGRARLFVPGLGPDQAVEARVVAEGLGGLRREAVVAFRTPPPLLPLSITEARADPIGPEPRQEYVELLNYGEEPVPLLGVAIADSADTEGDRIEGPYLLPAGARALLVADAFDPEDPSDEGPPPGVLLIPIGTSLARSGLGNSGEPLFLRDPEGRRLSAMPASPAPERGLCSARISESPRSGAEGDFAIEVCTPGRPERMHLP